MFDPAHLHLIVNHAPVFFGLAGLFVLLVGLFRRSMDARLCGTIILLVAAIGGLVAYWTGEQAYDAIRRISDKEGQRWLAWHWDRAEWVRPFLWAQLLLAAVSLAMEKKKSRWLAGTQGLLFLVTLVTLAIYTWVALAGGKVRHTELRAPPALTVTPPPLP